MLCDGHTRANAEAHQAPPGTSADAEPDQTVNHNSATIGALPRLLERPMHEPITKPALDFLSIDEVCRVIGGSRPVNRATVYRAVAAGRLPKPVRVSPNVARWLRSELEVALQRMIAARMA